MKPRRVVITGIGVVTPIGTGRDEFWSGLQDRISRVGPITRFDPSPFRTRMAGEVPDFRPADHIEARRVRRFDRFAQFGVAATRLALADSAIDLAKEDRERIGSSMGTALAGVARAEEEHGNYMRGGLRAVDPSLALAVFGGAASCNVAIEFGLSGPNTTNGMSCASGTMAIGDGFRAIARGDADVMVSGGTEAPLAPLCFGAFAVIRAMSTRNDDPTSASRPFDRERDGFVMAEGAAVLVLEERERALARGAHIYAEICGYGVTNDAHHMTQPRPDGRQAARAMALALGEAHVAPGRDRLHQRARLIDAAQRPDRNQRHQAGVRGARPAGRDQRNQGLLRPRARGERRLRGGDLRAGEPASLAAAHGEPHDARPGLRPVIHRRPGPERRPGIPAQQLIRFWGDQCRDGVPAA